MNILKSILDLFPIFDHKHYGKSPSVLFVLKKRDVAWGHDTRYSHHSSGLLNSATFINDMLRDSCIRSGIVEVIDGNDIDREVFKFNPDIVIIEAVWCPPSKVRELAHLHHHRHRKWIIRNHSELPFLAMEGIALEWLLEYPTIKNTFIACNSPVAIADVATLAKARRGVSEDKVVLLTNYYPIPKFVDYTPKPFWDSTIDISCFGAIRPLKNHVEQATAAIMFANSIGLKLRFHVNSTRIEGKGDPILKSLRGMFDGDQYKLVEHGWLDRKEFLELCSTMNIGLQVSFSETFNIVGADHVSVGVPIVGSNEIPWLDDEFQASPTVASDIAEKIGHALHHGAEKQVDSLAEYNKHTKRIWMHQLHTVYTK